MGDAGTKKKKKRSHASAGKTEETEEVTSNVTSDNANDYSGGEDEAWDSDDEAPFLRYIFDKQERLAGHEPDVKISEAAMTYVTGLLAFNCGVCRSASRPFFNKKKTTAGLCADSKCEASSRRAKKETPPESSESVDGVAAPSMRAKSRSTLKVAITFQQAKIARLTESARVIQDEMVKEQAILSCLRGVGEVEEVALE